MKKKIFIGLSVFFGIIILILGQYIISNLLFRKEVPVPSDLITAAPINLENVSGLSKFRSCQGHDLSGYNEKGIKESNRSMKHYIFPKREFNNTIDKFEVYAPFDGKIFTIFNEGRGDQIIIKSDKSDWGFVFFHIRPIKELKRGDSVKSGELLGYASLENGSNFDIGMQYQNDNSLFTLIVRDLLGFGEPPFLSQLTSPFELMYPDVLNKFESAGFKKDDLILSKEFRDQNPCDFSNERKYFDTDVIFVNKEQNPINTHL